MAGRVPVKKTLLNVAFCATAASVASTAFASDFGEKAEQLAAAMSEKLFGVNGTLDKSSTLSRTAAEGNADATSLATVANGLIVGVASADANLGPNIDQ